VPGADEIAQRDDGDEPTRGVEGEGELTSTPGQPNAMAPMDAIARTRELFFVTGGPWASSVFS